MHGILLRRGSTTALAIVLSEVAAYRKVCPGAQIILIGPLLQGLYGTGPIQKEKIALIQALADTSFDLYVTFVDTRTGFLNSDGNIIEANWTSYMINPQGERAFADLLRPVLSQYLPTKTTPAK